MTKHQLNAIGLTFLAMVAAACGDPGMAPLEEDFNFEEPPVDEPIVDEPIVDDVIENEEELIAPFDNDSAANPAVDEFLSITGTREIAYTDQISSEDGDNEDFVQFELPNNSNPNQRIEVAIDCDVYGDQDVFARVELLNVDGNGATRIGGPPIDCNEGVSFVTVQNDQVQLARVYVQGLPEEQTLVEYTILVTAF